MAPLRTSTLRMVSSIKSVMLLKSGLISCNKPPTKFSLRRKAIMPLPRVAPPTKRMMEAMPLSSSSAALTEDSSSPLQ